MASGTLLSVGSEGVFQKQLRAQLNKKKYLLLEVKNQGEIKELLSENIDVVLIDTIQLGYNGISILDDIRWDYSFLPVICLVAAKNMNLSLAAMRHGAYDEIQLPCSWNNLFKTIDLAVKHKRKFARDKKKSLWKRIEDYIAAGNIADAGATELAKKWLQEQKNKSEK